MTQDIKEHAPQTKESGGRLRHLFGRSGRDTPGPDAKPERSTLDLADIQASSCAVTGCRSCGISD